ncbi:MAG: AAA family ATPase, partial [Acidimicrobiia bacterium]|nr:AAA family ATPase [Acidimicrobiia bacterium]
MTCRSCGATVAEGARFCSNCGAVQAGSDERRVVTAVFADIVGFTTLAENRDPEEVKRLVDRCFERLARDITSFGGVVDKVMGDGIIALFGAPTAHEDDAERAVRAALRMQETLDKIADPDPEKAGGPNDGADADVVRIRIGVNTGEVLVGASTAGGDYTAMGDVMNTASRLEQLAEPGQILVGEATYALTDHAIRYHALGPLVAKGRDGPLEAWVALEATRPPGSYRQANGLFVGRTHELGVLESQARLAFELRQSQLSLVIGEAGIGKSRLVQQFTDRLRQRYDTQIWRGHCVPYGEANVWWPVAEIIRQLFGLDLDASQAETERIITSELSERLGPDRSTHLDRSRTALLHAMGFPTGLRGGEPTQNRAEVTQAFSHLLERALSEGPVVMMLSDMHWAGDAVWDLLDRLLNQWSRHQLLIVATARGIDRAGFISGRHGASVLRLGPLSDSAARQLLAGLRNPGDEPLDPETIDDLVARSGGNPFFLEELAGLVLRPGSAGGSGAIGELPDTLRGIIAARLDSLSAGERALLEDAAMLGR